MSSIELRLHGGPHHNKEGWFTDDQDGHPPTLYVSDTPDRQPMIFGDTHHPFAQGPFQVYRFGGISSDGKTRIYHYDPATEAP